MTSIFSGQLYNNFLKDNNQYRLETYDVNRFQRTIEQMSNQGLAEKELREGLVPTGQNGGYAVQAQ